MQTADMILLVLEIASGFNAMRFEQQSEESRREIRDLRKKIDEGAKAGLDPDLAAKLRQDLEDIETVSALTGNWLPSKYRQFISFTVIALIFRLMSPEAAVIVFILLCGIGSTRAIKFWLDVVIWFRKLGKST